MLQMLKNLRPSWHVQASDVTVVLEPSGNDDADRLPPSSQRTQRIAQLVGMPPEHFQGLYQSVINNAKAYLHANQADDQSTNQRLYYALALAERALNIRQAYLLPTDAPPEELARRSDRWTYGVFLMAFLHGLAGPRPNADQSTQGYDLAATLLPAFALNWLNAEPALAQVFESQHDHSNQSAIFAIDEIIARALGKHTGRSAMSPCDPAEVFASDESPLLRLPACIDQLRNEGRMSFNRKHADAFVTDTEFWLEARSGLGLVRAWLIDESGLLPPPQSILMDLLQAHSLCLSTPDKAQAVWNVEVTHPDDTTARHRLICFPIELIWPKPGQRPPSFHGKLATRWSERQDKVKPSMLA